MPNKHLVLLLGLSMGAASTPPRSGGRRDLYLGPLRCDTRADHRAGFVHPPMPCP